MKYLHISVSDPFPPETPQNARIGNQTVHPNSTVSVLVLWEAPGESDLVVHHYKVTWSTRGTPPSSQSRAGRVTDGVSPPELRPLSHPSAGVFSQILLHTFISLLNCEPVGGYAQCLCMWKVHFRRMSKKIRPDRGCR